MDINLKSSTFGTVPYSRQHHFCLS